MSYVDKVQHGNERSSEGLAAVAGPGPILQGLTRVEDRYEEIERLFYQLKDRLDIILQPDYPEVEKASDPVAPDGSRMEYRLSELTTRMDNLVGALVKLRGRIAL